MIKHFSVWQYKINKSFWIFIFFFLDFEKWDFGKVYKSEKRILFCGNRSKNEKMLSDKGSENFIMHKFFTEYDWFFFVFLTFFKISVSILKKIKNKINISN